MVDAGFGYLIQDRMQVVTKKLNSWLLSHYKSLALKVTQLDWIQNWMPGHYDFQVSITLEGRQHIGRGVDNNSDLAFTKAAAEALERGFCFENHISTSGVAVHTEESAARENAKNELIERDRFFCHYFTATPFEEIGDDSYHGIREKLKKHNITMKIFEMNPLNQTRSFVCLSTGERVGLVVGLGTCRDKSVAIKKSVIECLINTVASLHGKVTPIKFRQFEALASCQPEDHRRLYLGESVLIKKNSWMLDGGGRVGKPEFVDEDRFRYSRLIGKNYLLRESPLVAVKCENELLQKSIYGRFNLEHVNSERIKNFAKVPEINNLPHPLG